MGNKSSQPYPRYPPPPHHYPPFDHHPPPPPGAIDEGWARRPAPIQRAPGWAGSRMSLAGSHVDLAYAVSPHEQMIVLPPDPKMLKKIHKEQKKLLKRMRGLPVEVIVAPMGSGGRLPGPAHPPPHMMGARTYSIGDMSRDYAVYTQRDVVPPPRRPVSSANRWGSTGPNGSIDSPMTSSAGSNTIDHPSWISSDRPPSGPATNLARSETDRLDWARRRVVTTTHIERGSMSPPPPRRSSPLMEPLRTHVHGDRMTGRPRSLWMEEGRRAHSSSAVHAAGRQSAADNRRTINERSNWSSSAASSDRLGGSTGDIDFSWVREEEGRLRDRAPPRDKTMPECYFGREEEVPRQPPATVADTKNETRKSREINDSSATMSMAF